MLRRILPPKQVVAVVSAVEAVALGVITVLPVLSGAMVHRRARINRLAKSRFIKGKFVKIQYFNKLIVLIFSSSGRGKRPPKASCRQKDR